MGQPLRLFGCRPKGTTSSRCVLSVPVPEFVFVFPAFPSLVVPLGRPLHGASGFPASPHSPIVTSLPIAIFPIRPNPLFAIPVTHGPFWNLAQDDVPPMPILPNSRTICIVRPRVSIGGCSSVAPSDNWERVAGSGGVLGRRPCRPATAGRAGACHAEKISGIYRCVGGRSQRSLGSKPDAGYTGRRSPSGHRPRRGYHSRARACAGRHATHCSRPTGRSARAGANGRPRATAWANVPEPGAIHGSDVSATTAIRLRCREHGLVHG